ncbi:autotransporter-associated beta strand repeat-containing protein, partial [Rhizobiaceae sp. 2RAB30]
MSDTGSHWDVSGALDLRRASLTVSGGLVTAASLTVASTAGATGTMTIADGGVVRPGDAMLAMGPGNAVLNIGGAEDGPAARAGTLDASALSFGASPNRVNFNHTDTGYVFAAAMSGAGAVNQNGPGATVLTGANSYAGVTTINAGSLFINGDQTRATGLTTVKGGAALGGVGTIGGNVVVADGAAIDPGDLGGAPGTLTIAGDLDLAAGAVLGSR